MISGKRLQLHFHLSLPYHGHWVASRLLPVYFFFQAEDGIRDLTVTGVQTCALPISFSITMSARIKGHLAQPSCSHSDRNPICGDQITVELLVDDQNRVREAYFDGKEIGRASCRERV